jgi:hypothetical protein
LLKEDQVVKYLGRGVFNKRTQHDSCWNWNKVAWRKERARSRLSQKRDPKMLTGVRSRRIVVTSMCSGAGDLGVNLSSASFLVV